MGEIVWWVINIAVSVGVWWVLTRPLDTFYKARLIDESRGCAPAEALVAEFLGKSRPTCREAAFLLKKIGRLKKKLRDE